MCFVVTTIISLMMFCQGVLLTRYHGSGDTASISALIAVCGGEVWAGCLLIVTLPFSFLAQIPRFGWLLLPQWLVSLVYAAGSIHSMVVSSYADKYVPAGGDPFIINDQIGYIALYLIHTVVIGVYLF